MSQLRTIERWKQKARHLKIEIYALYLAYRDPRVPWYAKAFVALVVGYAFSPIDLIPDFIPGIGFIDDAAVIAFTITSIHKDLDKFREWERSARKKKQ